LKTPLLAGDAAGQKASIQFQGFRLPQVAAESFGSQL
jgi:hypothetical protein